MKQKNLFIVLLALVATVFAACKDEVPVREQSPADNASGIYIFDNEADITILPLGDKYVMTRGGVKDTIDALAFNVIVGRSSVEAADSCVLEIEDEDGAFTLNPKVNFAKGEAFDTIAVEVGLVFGQEADLKLTVPAEKASTYSAASKTIHVAVDYTWLPRGKAEFIQDLYPTDEPVVVAVEKAKEATDSLYRLTNVFEETAKAFDPDNYEDFARPNMHLKFIADPNANYKVIGFATNGSTFNPQHMTTIGWDGARFDLPAGDLEIILTEAMCLNISYTGYVLKSSENQYSLSSLFVTSDGSCYLFNCQWNWTEGFPGVVANPSEGEGAVDTLSFGDGKLKAEAGAVTEVLDDVLNITQAHNRYTLSFEEDGLNLGLVLVGDSLGGDYKIVSNPIQAGTALAGSYDGTAIQGCYVDAGFTKYYITSGNVHVDVEGTNYSIQVKGVTATGVELIIECEGTLTEEGATPAPSKVAVRKLTL